ncbi:cache domain-containing sensor histidine kinase [Paenibacillus vini]|uniref:HAMP domain-containing protein n=1 Tax=Paenibacillus vini TaxID=1476024 RepID=A0ABQ4MAP3_9BACL|nr:sensor histidine kinase [Paenibacillus vini]GIP52988.1 hypothetical protein J42TS3_20230 [Paenibacillus vini]
MKSIQNRLILLLLVFIIIPYFLSVWLIYQQTKENVERHELQNSQEQVEQVSTELEQYFEEIVNLSYILYRNPDLFSVFEQGFEGDVYRNQLEINKGMRSFYLMRNEIRQLRFFINEGKSSFTVYNAMLSTRKINPNLLQQAPIQKLMGSKANYRIEPPHQIENYNQTSIMPPSDKTMVVTIHHKVTNVLTQEFIGIITFDIDLDKIANLSRKIVRNNKEVVLLTDSDGYVIYASEETLIGKIMPEDVRSKISSSTAGVVKSPEGEIVMSRTLQGPIKNWHFVQITPSEFLFEDVRQTAYRNIMVGVIVGGLGLIMIAIISYKFTRPIKLLSQKVQRIEGGNMHVRFDDQREDEIGSLERHIQEMMNRINRHIDREYKLEIENRKNQHRALKSQINPHFLFNALQSIAAVALMSGSPKVYQLITSLSKMMRYSIRVDQKATVRSEVEYVQAYLKLQQERFQTDFSYSIDIPEDILDNPVPSMILQPLVENFFKHCYDEGVEHAYLRVYGEIQGVYLHLVVENHGSSLTPEALKALEDKIYTPVHEGNPSFEHIGLKNIHDRLVLHFDQTAGMILDSMQGQGFSVRLVIPLYQKEM